MKQKGRLALTKEEHIFHGNRIGLYSTKELLLEIGRRLRSNIFIIFSMETETESINSGVNRPPVGLKVKSLEDGRIGEVVIPESTEIRVKFPNRTTSYYEWRHFWINNEVDEHFKPQKVVPMHYKQS